VSEINREGILEILKWECMVCNYYEELGKGTVCDDCPFCKNSAPKRGEPSRVGLKKSVFLPLGLTNKQCENWGRHHLFMYLYYPELNWKPPPIPEYDSYGFRVNREKARQTIHHLNGNNNDNRKENITWKLVSDHIRDEQQNFRLKREIKKDAKRCAKTLGLKVD